MRWASREGIKEGSWRKRSGFLFLPKCVNGWWRWWEYAYWSEEARRVMVGLDPKCYLKWMPARWLLPNEKIPVMKSKPPPPEPPHGGTGSQDQMMNIAEETRKMRGPHVEGCAMIAFRYGPDALVSLRNGKAGIVKAMMYNPKYGKTYEIESPEFRFLAMWIHEDDLSPTQSTPPTAPGRTGEHHRDVIGIHDQKRGPQKKKPELYGRICGLAHEELHIFHGDKIIIITAPPGSLATELKVSYEARDGSCTPSELTIAREGKAP